MEFKNSDKTEDSVIRFGNWVSKISNCLRRFCGDYKGLSQDYRNVMSRFAKNCFQTLVGNFLTRSLTWPLVFKFEKKIETHPHPVGLVSQSFTDLHRVSRKALKLLAASHSMEMRQKAGLKHFVGRTKRHELDDYDWECKRKKENIRNIRKKIQTKTSKSGRVQHDRTPQKQREKLLDGQQRGLWKCYPLYFRSLLCGSVSSKSSNSDATAQWVRSVLLVRTGAHQASSAHRL